MAAKISAVLGAGLALVLVSGCGSTPDKVGKGVGEEAMLAVAVPVMFAAVPVAVAVLPFRRVAQDRDRPGTGHVTIEDAYWAAYGVHANSVDVDQDTGRVLNIRFDRSRDLAGAQQIINTLQHRAGIPGNNYLLGSEAAELDGRRYLLLSILRRKGFRNPPLETGSVAWHTPDPRTDQVLDWVVIDAADIQQDRCYAYLLAAAGQTLIDQPQQPDYWAVSARWRAGQIAEVLQLAQQRAALAVRPMQSPGIMP